MYVMTCVLSSDPYRGLRSSLRLSARIEKWLLYRYVTRFRERHWPLERNATAFRFCRAGYFASKSGDKDTVLAIDMLLSLKKNDADIVQPGLACDVSCILRGRELAAAPRSHQSVQRRGKSKRLEKIVNACSVRHNRRHTHRQPVRFGRGLATARICRSRRRWRACSLVWV